MPDLFLSIQADKKVDRRYFAMNSRFLAKNDIPEIRL